jgi:hypothetical protein
VGRLGAASPAWACRAETAGAETARTSRQAFSRVAQSGASWTPLLVRTRLVALSISRRSCSSASLAASSDSSSRRACHRSSGASTSARQRSISARHCVVALPDRDRLRRDPDERGDLLPRVALRRQHGRAPGAGREAPPRLRRPLLPLCGAHREPSPDPLHASIPHRQLATTARASSFPRVPAPPAAQACITERERDARSCSPANHPSEPKSRPTSLKRRRVTRSACEPTAFALVRSGSAPAVPAHLGKHLCSVVDATHCLS